jgi:hypothetical protein
MLVIAANLPIFIVRRKRFSFVKGKWCGTIEVGEDAEYIVLGLAFVVKQIKCVSIAIARAIGYVCVDRILRLICNSIPVYVLVRREVPI